MAEMTVVAAMLLQRFEVTPLAGMAAPEPVFNISMRPGQPLRLKLVRLTEPVEPVPKPK
jgi:unspecific monooxygenase